MDYIFCLVPSVSDGKMEFKDGDFLLLGWSITHIMKDNYYTYDDYEFSKEEWNAVLEEAEKLVSFKCFDDLFEYVTSIEISSYSILSGGQYSVTLSNMNHSGEYFWKNIDRYRTILNKVKMWSVTTLSEEDGVIFYEL